MTGESSTGERCEWLSCSQEAWYRVSSQWSLFDWMHIFVCLDHLRYAESFLSHRLVEGQPPFHVDTVTLDIRDDH